MSKEMICCWCGEKMMYSVLGQNLTSSHFCDNVDCKAFQMVLPDNLWKDIFAWNQSQKDIKTALTAIKEIAEECGCLMAALKSTGFESVVETFDEKIRKRLKQIEHNNKEQK